MREVLIESGLYEFVSSSAQVGSLAVRTFRYALTPPFPWIGDAIIETSKVLRRCALPLTISMTTWVLGFAFFLLGGFLELLGAVDRMPGGLILGFTREPAIWVAAMIFGGVAGSAITADLAARKNREELDALTVLGVEQTRALVVPRVVAATIACPLLGLLAILTTWVVTYLGAPLFIDAAPGVVLDSMVHSTLSGDLWAAVTKFVLIGAYTGVMSCHKGLTAKSGTEGVGRAVNQNVVLVFLGIWVINSIFNVAYLSFFPALTNFKG
ncbi:ABC transporter permease [Paraconexibacter sp. AEG42_29]|uniref:ABC transporter permease n=1 Tax=Paraconexibacter sp. AEG42_29 TaxID=2997339 RepID=UPI00339D4386